MTFKSTSASLFFLVSFLLGSQANATFLPPNDLHLEVTLFDGEVSQEDFNEVIDIAKEIYEPIFAGHGAEIKFNRYWDNDLVNASAMRKGNVWIINMYGGLARRPEVTKDGFAMVLCHEIGHHLAGSPFVQRFGNTWAANEGQSDYFASLSCAKEIWKRSNQDSYAGTNIDPLGRSLCNEVWSTSADQKLCYRSLEAGKSLARLLARGGSVGFDTPDKTVVSATYHKHPKAQCRLDTYVAGALCQEDFDKNVIPSNFDESEQYTCTRSRQYVTGVRPLCWFKP